MKVPSSVIWRLRWWCTSEPFVAILVAIAAHWRTGSGVPLTPRALERVTGFSNALKRVALLARRGFVYRRKLPPKSLEDRYELTPEGWKALQYLGAL